MPLSHIRGVLLDIDGTLIDSNDAHALAWVDALDEFGFQIPFERVRTLIGMGGDKLLPAATGLAKDSDQGKKISERRGQIFKTESLPTLKAFPKTRDLLVKMRSDGLKLVVATSAQPDELRALLEVAKLSDLIEDAASSGDAKNSKPDPDIVQAALSKSGYSANEVIMLGDTPYDVQAASKAGLSTIALRCGGWKDQELAGAVAIYNDPADLLAHYTESPLARAAEVK